MSTTIYACGFNGFQQLVPKGPTILESWTEVPEVERVLELSWSGLRATGPYGYQARGYAPEIESFPSSVEDVRMIYASGKGVHLMDGSVWEVRNAVWERILEHVKQLAPIESLEQPYLTALLEDGDLVAWRIGESTPKTLLVKAGRGGSVIFTHVRAGHAHFLALSSEGEVYAWGDNRFGQLGLDRPISSVEIPQPEVITALQGLKMLDIACGSFHSVVLAETGDIYTFGWNKHGQLGLGRTTDQDLDLGCPQLVEFPQGPEVNVRSIACGSHHTVILDDARCVWAAGWGKWGQCGKEGSKDTFHPLLLQAPARPRSILCGPWSTLITVDHEQ